MVCLCLSSVDTASFSIDFTSFHHDQQWINFPSSSYPWQLEYYQNFYNRHSGAHIVISHGRIWLFLILMTFEHLFMWLFAIWTFPFARYQFTFPAHFMINCFFPILLIFLYSNIWNHYLFATYVLLRHFVLYLGSPSGIFCETEVLKYNIARFIFLWLCFDPT